MGLEGGGDADVGGWESDGFWRGSAAQRRGRMRGSFALGGCCVGNGELDSRMPGIWSAWLGDQSRTILNLKIDVNVERRVTSMRFSRLIAAGGKEWRN